MAKLGFICLALFVLIAATQVEVDGFKLRRFGTGFKKIIKDGIRFLFGRRQQPQTSPVRPAVLAPANSNTQVDVDEIKPTEAPVVNSPYKRTIIAIKQETSYGQYLYLRGGGPEGKPIDIRHRIAPEDQDSFYASTSQGDDHLDWGSNEINQGRYKDDITPQGTPMMWTTNDENYDSAVGQDGAGYYNINVQSGHYWLVDIDMDCSQTTDGWFEFKGYLTWDGQIPVENGWEKNFKTGSCQTEDGPQTFDKADPVANNHIGRCGEFNLVHFESSMCMIHSLADIEQWAKDFHGDEKTVEE
ncbi:hypothetical protein SNE40_016602 [Patella caerulea]|uniref:Uncharacterized protein n=1 Tax=Patella caerulea TaxID=87958 RepID=A0AAN8JDD8_PATCE